VSGTDDADSRRLICPAGYVNRNKGYSALSETFLQRSSFWTKCFLTLSEAPEGGTPDARLKYFAHQSHTEANTRDHSADLAMSLVDKGVQLHIR